jgi:hypothetical protein
MTKKKVPSEMSASTLGQNEKCPAGRKFVVDRVAIPALRSAIFLGMKVSFCLLL